MELEDRPPADAVAGPAKLRHIAISVPDPEAAAVFFEQAFGMHRAGKAGRGVYMSDGIMNVALLSFPPNYDIPGVAPCESFHGVIHFGMWVDDLEAAEQRVTAAGGTYVNGRPDNRPNTFYEVKYASPAGLVFDITHTGWAGAVKDVQPAPPAATEA